MVILFDNPLRVLINYELQSPREAFPDCLEEVSGTHGTKRDRAGQETVTLDLRITMIVYRYLAVVNDHVPDKNIRVAV